MGKTVRLRNINPLGQVDLPLLARQGEPFDEHGSGCLEPGEVFECPAELAGRAPSGEPGSDDYDLGEGLLAQVGNYELADKPKKKRAPGERTAKKTQPAQPPEPPTEDDPAAPAADTATEV